MGKFSRKTRWESLVGKFVRKVRCESLVGKFSRNVRSESSVVKFGAPVAPLHPWEWPGRTWHRRHIGHAGRFEGRMILIIVNAHNKYIDGDVMSAAMTSATLTKLRKTFAILGLPNTIVSDNRSRFRSEEFDQLCRAKGVKHIKCSPYHPSSNGLAERAVQTVKAGLKKTKLASQKIVYAPSWHTIG